MSEQRVNHPCLKYQLPTLDLAGMLNVYREEANNWVSRAAGFSVFLLALTEKTIKRVN